MLLARWAGSAVLRYVREAPLAKLPAEVKALDEQRSVLAALLSLQHDVAVLGDGVRAQAEGQAKLAAEFRNKFGPDAAHSFVARGDSKRLKCTA